MVAVFGGASSCNGSRVRGGDMYRLVASVASEAMGLGKASQVLTVLGGKASCRRKFVLNLHLVDEYGSLVSRDFAIVASVAYAHDHSPVVRDEKPFLVEPPLFTTFNGVEFPAQDRPTRMVSGRASFKLAISLLSSKCDNRLFCICFTPQAGPGDAAPICPPCYSKPIRSISRKRTQSPHVSPAPPLLLLAGMESSPPSASNRYNNKNSRGGGGGGSGESEEPKCASPETSSENDGEGHASPRRRHLLGYSRSNSATSMHYLTPAAGITLDDHGVGRRCRTSSECETAELVLHESPTGHRTAGTLGSLLAGTTVDRFGDTDPSGSSSGNMAMSLSCSPVSSINPPDINDGLNNIPCSLSLRLSPSDSSSPTSGGLTSESSFDNNKDPSARSKSSPLAAAISRPSPGVQAVLASAARPFRPYASVGACKLPMTDFQLGPVSGMSLTSPRESLKRQSPSSNGDTGNTTSTATHTLLERVHQQLRAVSPGGNSSSKVESILHNFSLGSCGSDEKFASAFTEISLEEEEKSLQYIEVSLQEVSRDVQRRKEELRSKRRRLLEDEARMHSIILQSSSWIESLSGRFSL